MRQGISIPTIDVKQYGGKQVAVIDGKIVAAGQTLEEVITKAKAQAPSRPLSEIKIFSVPPSLSVIYYVSSVSVRNHSSRRRTSGVVSRR